MQRLSIAIIVAGCGAISVGSAAAEEFLPDVIVPSLFNEFRFGVQHHDLHVAGFRDEKGVDINMELLFRRPGFAFDSNLMTFIFNPRPHIGAHINTKGFTSQAYTGITWDYRLTEQFFFEASFGAAYHTGNLTKNVAGEKRPLGCRVNFRESASLGYEFTKQWRAMITYDHISNANLCSENAGLSTIGARLGYKF